MGIIYKITSPTGRLYVGQTTDLKRRISDYRFKIKKYNTILFHSIKKYGWKAHKFEIIENDVPDDKLDEREMFWISEFNTYRYMNDTGMNMTIGGEGHKGSWMHDVERRETQAKRFSGEGNPFFGQHHTDEWKSKKSKEVSEYNKKIGWRIPEWGAEKGRQKVIKPVVCYNSDGSFLKEYESGAQAADELIIERSSITMVCGGKRSHVNGYVFRYKTDNYPLKIEVGKLNEQAVKKPIICVYKNKKMEFPSAAEASEKYGIPKTTIIRAAAYRNGKPIRTGHIFHYKNKN